MSTTIHPTAVVDPSAELGEGVSLGPFSVVGADVELGDGCQLGAHSVVQGPARLGSDNRVYPHACLGQDPQDLKYEGEPTRVEIGDRNLFREFCTVHRGTVGGGERTTIGSDNLFNCYSHVAHDCHVGSKTVFSNCGTLAGHVEVGDWARVGAFSAVHQFCRVGEHSYIGGYSVITMDVLPFSLVVGEKPRCLGLNKVGLERRGFSKDEVRQLELAFRVLLRSRMNTTQALTKLEEDGISSDLVQRVVDFIRSSQRGVIKTERSGRRGS